MLHFSLFNQPLAENIRTSIYFVNLYVKNLALTEYLVNNDF